MSDPFAVTDPQEKSEANDSQAIDPRLLEMSRAYMDALRAGESPKREEYLSRYPDLRDEARDYLEGIEIAHSLEQAKEKESLRAVISSSSKVSDRVDFQGGAPIGDFCIHREIGRGGMGTVYEATQISLGRSVALKVLPFAAALDERHRKRFLLEAQSAAQLHHQNIVPVYAVGCERGTHYYAMQLIYGEPISAKLFSKEKALEFDKNLATVNARADGTSRASATSMASASRSTRNRFQRVAALIADVAVALEYAHSCGIVHRDIKPGNLLLDLNGKIWITDFGLAYIATGEHVTQTGEMLGTMRYMSPEQATGSRGVVDHRSDIYSLGATLYELLTGEPVFKGSDRQSLLNQVLNSEPKSLRSVDASIPEELETITLKALSHSPSERYESAQAFAEDLQRYLDQMPILARRPTMLDQTRKWMRRHPTVVMSLLFSMVAAMISLAITTAVVTRQKSITQQSLDQAERRLATAQAAADEMISLAENEFTKTPMEETLRLRLLSSALIYYRALLDDPDLNVDVRERFIATRDRVSKIHDDLLLLRDDRPLAYLSDESVLDDLQLNESQRKQLQAMGSLVSDSEDSMSQVKEAQARKLEVNRILTSEQRTRLRQIAIQLRAPTSILESIINGQIRISDAQLTAIQRAIVTRIHTTRLDPDTVLPLAIPEVKQSRSASFGPDAMMDVKTRHEVTETILNQMTPEQRHAWATITGPVFVP